MERQSSLFDFIVPQTAMFTIESLLQNRKERNGRNTGEGVAIAYKQNRISLKPFPIRKGGCEIAVAHGRIINNTNPVCIIALYPSRNEESEAGRQPRSAV